MKRYLFFLIILLTSCHSDKSGNKTVETTYTIEQSSTESGKELFDRFKETDVVALQTTKESIIANIKDIKSYKNRIYIYDNKQHSIFIFDNQGRYISKIDKRGRGKNEYISLKDIEINPNNGDLVVLDNMSYKLLIYDLNGEFKKHVDIKYKNNFTEVAFVNDTTYLLLSKGSSHTSNFSNNNMIYTFNQEGELISDELSFPDSYNRSVYNSFHVNISNESNGQLMIRFPYDNRVFAKNCNGLTCEREFIFEGYKRPSDYFMSLNSNNAKLDYIENDKSISFIGENFVEFSDHLLCDIVSNEDILYMLYDKKNNRSQYYSFQKMPAEYFVLSSDLRFYKSWDNKVITISFPNIASNILKQIKIDERGKNIDKTIKYMKGLNISPDQNPILLFSTL